MGGNPSNKHSLLIRWPELGHRHIYIKAGGEDNYLMCATSVVKEVLVGQEGGICTYVCICTCAWMIYGLAVGKSTIIFLTPVVTF